MKLTQYFDRFVILGYLNAKLLNFLYIKHFANTLSTASLAQHTQNPES